MEKFKTMFCCSWELSRFAVPGNSLEQWPKLEFCLLQITSVNWHHKLKSLLPNWIRTTDEELHLIPCRRTVAHQATAASLAMELGMVHLEQSEVMHVRPYHVSLSMSTARKTLMKLSIQVSSDGCTLHIYSKLFVVFCFVQISHWWCLFVFTF